MGESNNLRYADDPILMAESQEELKNLLMIVKETERAGLKLNIKKTKIMASGPVTSWQIEGKQVEVVRDFLFLGSKITADGLPPRSQKMIASWQESYAKPRQCVEKQRYHSAGKGPCSQGYGLSSGHVWL